MALIGYAKDDVESRQPLAEGEYLFMITDVRVEPADEAQRGSMIPVLEVVDGPDVKGRTTTRYFALPSGADKDEKSKDGRSMYGTLLSFIEDFVTAVGGKWTAKGFDTAELSGRQVYGTVTHDMYDGRPQERISKWRSA